MRPISPSIDPTAHRAAIDALEAQRAAYRRFARQAEAQSSTLNAGEVDQVEAFTDGAMQEAAQLHDGARHVRALVDEATSRADDASLQELERRMADMMREARSAEAAIRNLSTQLEAWRDAYGRQLAELGVTPGGETTSAPSTPTPYGGGSFGTSHTTPRLLDRKG